MAKQRFKKDYEQSMKKYDEQHSGGGSSNKDPRFFKPQAGKNGNATITLRFLPSKDTDTDFVKADSHDFNTRTGSFYFDNCLKNIGEECPICDYTWGNWIKDDKEHNEPFKKYIPKTKFIMNIVVLRDKEVPENEGKVFLYKFGNQIMKKIREQTSNGVFPWDWDEGLDFKLKIEQTTVNGKPVPTYDASYFVDDEGTSPLSADVGDEDLFALSEFIDPKGYRSAKEISARFLKATGIDLNDEDAPVVEAEEPATKAKAEVKEEKKAVATKERSSSKKEETKADAKVDEDSADEDGFVIEDDDEDPASFFSSVDSE